uniref:Ig-like domain-containing protein n=1 Tax=Pelusios castaneus TaxID=367368 RepID=A0A8C8S9T0_9SAUR
LRKKIPNLQLKILNDREPIRVNHSSVEKFVLSNLRVFWQTKDNSVVHTLSSGHENVSQQSINFRNRTRLFQDKLEDGIFSLLLLNVSLRDENTYHCIVQKKDPFFQVIHKEDVVLKIAANNSQPVLRGPLGMSPNIGEEVTLNCSYSQGYPKPKVYWIDGKDNSSLHPSEAEIIQDTDGTYSVFSTLKINTTSDVTVGCIIENELLQQNQSKPLELTKQIISPVLFETIFICRARCLIDKCKDKVEPYSTHCSLWPQSHKQL